MTEIEVARKFGLFWANCIDEENELFGTYVYTPLLPLGCFDEIATKLNQLNDYVFSQLCSTAKLYENAKNELNDSFYKQMDWCLDKEFAQNEFASWDYSLKVFSRVNPIILISTFMEWSLKILLLEYSGSVSYKKTRGSNAIEAMLSKLISDHQLDIVIPPKFQLKLDKYRKIRNNFAHGDWDKISSIEDSDIRDYIIHTSRLLKALEVELIAKKHTYSRFRNRLIG